MFEPLKFYCIFSIHVFPQYPNSGAGSSPIDMDMINVFKDKKITQTPWIWATLYQGDCLFVPAGRILKKANQQVLLRVVDQRQTLTNVALAKTMFE